MKHNTECILDDSGFKVEVDFDYEVSKSEQVECHGFHDVGSAISIDLNSVKLVIEGQGIDILPMLNKKQRDFIIDQLAA